MDQTKRDEAALEQAEQFESIPWSGLMPDGGDRKRKVVFTVLTVVAGIVIGLIGGRVIKGSTQPGVVITLPPVAAPASGVAVGAAAAAPPTDAPASTTPVADASPPVSVLTPVPAQLYSEADLMAVMPEEEMRTAAMRAEWFVADYFTIDGDASSAADVAAALPGEDVGPLPHRSGATGLSYVEWSRAFRVEPLGPGRYRVAVAFRTLAGPSAGSLVRTQVRAVSVDVEVGVDGATGLLDFPSPLPLPGTLAVEALAVMDLEAPPEVLAGALQEAARMGSDPSVLEAGMDDAGWRVVVLVGDESGLRWPVVVRQQSS